MDVATLRHRRQFRGVYGAIRADLAAIRTKVEQASVAANHAHRRIDDLLMMKKANEQ